MRQTNDLSRLDQLTTYGKRHLHEEAGLSQERLEELEAQGYIRLGRGKPAKFRAVKSRGKLASEMIIEDRR